MFRPVRDFILVEPVTVEQQSAGGIVLPESARKGQLRGRVVRVGEGRWNASQGRFHGFSCGVGDTILFNEFAGTELSVGGRDFVVLRDADVIGVFE